MEAFENRTKGQNEVFSESVYNFFNQNPTFLPIKQVLEFIVEYVQTRDKRGTSKKVDIIFKVDIKMLNPEFKEENYKPLVDNAYKQYSLNKDISTKIIEVFNILKDIENFDILFDNFFRFKFFMKRFL